MDDSGSLASTDKEMGDLLNAFFVSVFSKENIDHFPAVKQQYQGEENGKLYSFSITSDMVKSKLQKLKMNKAPGVDLVSSRMLLELSEKISDTVAELFTKTLDSGDVSLDCKLANVTAVLKKVKNQVLQIIDRSA